MMEVQQDESRMTSAVDASVWPDVDPRPLGLEDPWRLRVAAARVFSIVKNRDVGRFERAVGFLEATHRLLPGLVASIKHMKITFGLKTLVIMRMLRVGRGMVETVLKTSQFFPSKLPQYQGQCSQREMFLMRKNHLDFKTLAQALAMNKDKLEYYVANQMEEQYGERYAQKVEDRLLHYLQELEAALPGDSYIDKILKKESPVTEEEEEEEKLLMEVITSDAADVATTLKKLLRCDVASCRPGSTSPSTAMEMSPPSRPALRRRRSSEPPETLPRFQPEVFLGGTEADGEEAARRTEEAPASPQFCSKHQRWVRSILQECSEELPPPPQAHASSSPLLFPSSSPDAPSSEDLTPSDIVPLPPDQPRPPTQTAAHLLAGVQAPEGDRRSGSAGSGIDASHTELPLSSRDTRASVRLSPVVRLLDIASVTCKPCRVLLKRFPASGVKRVLGPEVLTSPHRHTAERDAGPLATSKDPATHPAAATAPNAAVKMEPAPSSPAGCLALGAEPSRGPRVHAKPSPPSQASHLQPDLPRTDLPQPDHLPQPDLPRDHLPRDHLPQPYVRVYRLSAQQCCRVTKPRSSVVPASSRDEDEDEDKDADSSFDVNTLYSGDSSSDSEDPFHGDPEYKPRFKKKRLPSQ
ncbi:uncharacterized protein LOC144383669 isoform X2 [Gasterosteus aculeatus]